MIHVSVNAAPLFAKLKKFGLATRQPMNTLVKDQARLFISSSGKVPGMVQLTPPHSAGVRGGAAKKQGEMRTMSDIRKVYMTPGKAWSILRDRNETLAAGFWRAIKNSRWTEAERIMRESDTELSMMVLRHFDGGQLHKTLRNKTTGRIQQRHASVIVRDPKALKKFIDGSKKNVGIYGSGFNAAALSLGAKGVPAWITRHGGEFSGVSITATATSFYITMSDRVPFGKAGTVRRMRYVLQYRHNALVRQMPFIIRKAMKTAGFAAVTT